MIVSVWILPQTTKYQIVVFTTILMMVSASGIPQTTPSPATRFTTILGTASIPPVEGVGWTPVEGEEEVEEAEKVVEVCGGVIYLPLIVVGICMILLKRKK
ncbi:MAG: hypothetical protein QMC80_00160 [Thermoplasmatales archaeon]|nr:hypothetical protein [Thermoplasmatales archaeon]